MIEDASEEVQKENRQNGSQPIVEGDASIPNVPLNRNLRDKRNSEKPADTLKLLVIMQNRGFKSVYCLLETDQKEDESECKCEQEEDNENSI